MIDRKGEKQKKKPYRKRSTTVGACRNDERFATLATTADKPSDYGLNSGLHSWDCAPIIQG